MEKVEAVVNANFEVEVTVNVEVIVAAKVQVKAMVQVKVEVIAQTDERAVEGLSTLLSSLKNQNGNLIENCERPGKGIPGPFF